MELGIQAASKKSQHFLKKNLHHNTTGRAATTCFAIFLTAATAFAAPPTLSIRRSNSSVIITWVPSTGFVLESTTNLAAGNWQTASENPLTNNGRLEVTATIGPKERYFRLGIIKLYPTIKGGREWYLPDNADLNNDPVFVPSTKDISIVQSGTHTVYHTKGEGPNRQVRLFIPFFLGLPLCVSPRAKSSQ